MPILFASAVFSLQWAYGINLGDEGWLWYVSQRVHLGEMPLRDSFGYDPGRYLWSAMWFKLLVANGLFDQRLANAIYGVIGLCAAYGAMLVARVQAPVRIACAAMLAVAMGFPLHKIYEQSSSLIGVALVAYALREPDAGHRWLILGLATGLIAIIGRNSGLYIALGTLLAILLVLRLYRAKFALQAVLNYSAGVLLGYAPMIIWFMVDAKFREAMIQSILFTPRWQLPLPIPLPWRIAQGWSSIPDLQNTAVSWLCLLVILCYAVHGIAALRMLARKDAQSALDHRSILSLAAMMVGIPYLHQSFDRADFSHIAQGVMPVFVLLATRLRPGGRLPMRLAVVAFFVVALAAWLPSEPRLRMKLLRQMDAQGVQSFAMDGRMFHIDRGSAELLTAVRHLADECHAADGQVVAMPYYPAVLAFLHLRTPYWEMFYLYHRDDDFQRGEIDRLEANGTKLAIVNTKAAMDGNPALRIEATNPLLYQYIVSHFTSVPVDGFAPGEPSFLIRHCDL